MKILSSLSEIIDNAKNGFTRFPITIIWAIIGTIYSIWFINMSFDRDVEFKHIKIILTFILGLSWLIATRLLVHYFKEERGKNKSWLIVIPLLFLVAYYFTLPNNKVDFDDVTIPYRFALFLITGHLFLFFSPFLFTWNKKAYWNYLKNIFTSFAQSALFSLVIYLGLTLALLALKYLFKFDFKEKIYVELFVFCLGIINTWIFLSDLPKNPNKQITIYYPKPLLVFVKYILIPLTILYLVILYAYSFKILIHWNLPKGWVSYLVMALAILGFIIHILINPIRKTSKSIVIKRFYPWFYYTLLPIIILLFVAIFKRVSDYGLTENRYLVLILAFWVLGMTLYILISKRKKLRYFPMSVAALSLLVSFGPWSIFSVSKNSQAHQFKKLYATMKANDFKIKSAEKNRFESITRYLIHRNAMTKVSDVLGYNPVDAFADKSQWNIVTKLSDSLGIEVIDYEEVQHNRAYNHYYSVSKKLIKIKGYDYLKQVYFNRNNYSPKISRYRNEQDNVINKYDFKLDSISKSVLFVLKKEDSIYKKIYPIDLKPLLKSLDENVKLQNKPIDQDKLTLIEDFEEVKIKILFQNIEVRTKQDQMVIPTEIMYANATILLKEK